jgi:hypothetical protein
MKPSYVVYECENCGGLFYRNVVETIVDDGADCHVQVEVLTDAEGNAEEFPMCACLGGDAAHLLEEVEEDEVEA